MSWIATLKSVAPDPQTPTISVSTISWSNGSTTLPDDVERGMDATDLINYVAQKTIALNKIDTMAAYMAAPPLGVITVPTTPSPTQAAIDLQNFERWMQLTTALEAAKNMGWITGTETVVQNVKSKILTLASTDIPLMFS